MPCLTYFDFPARAEATRLAFFVGNVEFEDKRISFEQFQDFVSDMPFTQVPVLEVAGVHHGQSTAMLRYAGKLSGLYPEDPLAAMKVDEIVMAAEDVNILIFSAWGVPPQKQKEMLDEMCGGKLKNLLQQLSAKLEANASSSPYFVGDSLTIADLQMFSVVITLESGILPAIPTSFVAEVAPLLKKHHDEAVSKYPKVAKYYASKSRSS